MPTNPGALHGGAYPVHINPFGVFCLMKRLRKFLKMVLFDENNSDDAWVLRCNKCGELLATDKPYLIESHKKWCRV